MASNGSSRSLSYSRALALLSGAVNRESAPVNGVLVGETQRATRHVIDYRRAEPVVAKGKSEPVAVWEAVQARSRFGVDVRQHGGAALVGRARELDALTAALERVRIALLLLRTLNLKAAESDGQTPPPAATASARQAVLTGPRSSST